LKTTEQFYLTFWEKAEGLNASEKFIKEKCGNDNECLEKYKIVMQEAQARGVIGAAKKLQK
jgi:hypothetical protein